MADQFQGSGCDASLEGDWNAMERLYTMDFIADPTSKTKSVVLSEKGEKRSKQLFAKHFAPKR
jgi:Domain of unknown function (DUF6429)